MTADDVPPLPRGSVDVVLDTDLGNEIDDQYALAYALLAPERLNLLAVYAAPFRSLDLSIAESVDRAAEEARHIVSLFPDRDAPPILPGCRGYLPVDGAPHSAAAVDHLVELARQRSRPPAAGAPLYVLALGCATNVATALLRAPDIGPQLVVVWDAAYPHFWPYTNRSFNMQQDVRAAQILFESGVPVVYIPGYYVAEQLRLTREEADRHLPEAGDVGAYLHQLFPERSSPHGALSHVMWDLANVAFVLQPDWVPTRAVPAPRLTSDLQWQSPPAPRHAIREAHGVDRDAIFTDLFSRLAARGHAAGGGQGARSGP